MRLSVIMTSGAALLVTECALETSRAPEASADGQPRLRVITPPVHDASSTDAGGLRKPARRNAKDLLQNDQYPLFKACRLLP
jgi:hypothetical protein